MVGKLAMKRSASYHELLVCCWRGRLHWIKTTGRPGVLLGQRLCHSPGAVTSKRWHRRLLEDRSHPLPAGGSCRKPVGRFNGSSHFYN